MAAENFIRDLSDYLMPGNLSDLTLIFGEKSWKIHKALACCHSKWFEKAVTGGFKESESGVITLKDHPEFANAIECMVSYFYKADYDVSQFDLPESLLHAQVAIVADEYDCASLYKLARTAFANTVKTAKGEEWVAVATLIYDHTTTILPAHKELRGRVVAAVANRPVELVSILELESTAGVLRSTADLATDLLLKYVSKAEMVGKCIFTCSRCQYAHVGSGNCDYVGQDISLSRKACPCCGRENGETSTQYGNPYTVELVESFPCPSCDGIHTVIPESETQ